MPMEGSEDREHFCEFMFERENDVVSFEPSGSSVHWFNHWLKQFKVGSILQQSKG